MSNGGRTHVALAMTGASGSAYGLRLLQVLLNAGVHVSFMVSTPGRMVIESEVGLSLSSRTTDIRQSLCDHLDCDSKDLQVHAKEDWSAPIASGSNVADAMVVCPCTTGTLASIAAGTSRSLIERAADVSLKEQKKLILVVRETPLSVIHLENMLRLAKAGALIMPANPGFYNQPQNLADLVDFIVARILDHLGVVQQLSPRWGAPRDEPGG